MGRSLTPPSVKQDIISDVAYAVCNFGSSTYSGPWYSLLNADFIPCKSIPNVPSGTAVTAVANYSSYGATTPSDIVTTLNPRFGVGRVGGTFSSTSNSSSYDGDLELARGLGGAQTNPGTSSSMYSNYTGRHGEFAHDHWLLNTNGQVIQTPKGVSWGTDLFTEVNDSFVNGDIEDTSLALLYWNSSLMLVERSKAHIAISSNKAPGSFISKFDIPGTVDDYYGNASYNRNRKELVIIGGTSASSNSGMFIRTYKNVPDITKTTDIGAVLSSITPVTQAISWSSWAPSNNVEAVGGCTPVLMDDGNVFVGFFNAGSALYIVKFTRGTNDVYTQDNHTSYGVTTSYGRNSARAAGMQVMQSRNGDSVVFYCQYYYYGCGIGVICMNKRTGYTAVVFTNSDSSYGWSVMRKGASDFVVSMNYSSSYNADNTNQVHVIPMNGRTSSLTNIRLPNMGGYDTNRSYPFMIEVSPYA